MGFVLTGGHSRRMGQDKALLLLGGQPLVLRMVSQLRPLVAEVMLVGAPERYAHFGIPTLSDRLSGAGPLAGLTTALAASSHDWNLVVACDLPYLESAFLEHLLVQARGGDRLDAVVPQVGGLWHPLCAAYHRRCLPAFEQALAAGERKVTHAFDRLRLHTVAEEELGRFAFSARMFKNMNTPEDYEEARRLLDG